MITAHPLDCTCSMCRAPRIVPPDAPTAPSLIAPDDPDPVRQAQLARRFWHLADEQVRRLEDAEAEAKSDSAVSARQQERLAAAVVVAREMRAQLLTYTQTAELRAGITPPGLQPPPAVDFDSELQP